MAHSKTTTIIEWTLVEPFLWHLIDIDWKPEVYFEPDEIILEWIKGERHAIVSIERDGHYGYTYAIEGSFVSGKTFDPHVSHFPEDLRDYLNENLYSSKT